MAERARRWLPAAGLALLLASVLACGGDWRRPVKAPGSALWLAAGSEPLTAAAISRLRELGAGELFVEAARVTGESGEVTRLSLPELPPSTPATLVIGGVWPAAIAEPEAFAERLAAAAAQLRFDAEAHGLIPVGIHLDPPRVGDLERYATTVDHLRGRLDRTLFLSTSVRRGWLGDEKLEEVVAAADFTVAFLYGQLPREREDPAAWDFVQLERGLQRLQAIGGRYMLGVITLGTATLRGKDGGAVKDRTTRMTLSELLWNRALELRPGFTLEGINRQVYTVVAERATELDNGWSLGRGDEVRVVRSATSDIEELQRLRGAWPLPGLLGQVFYRAPRPGEDLSLHVDSLIAGLDPAPAAPRLELAASLQRGTGRGWLFRVSLANRNSEVTELSLIDRNWVEVAADRGAIGRVEVGDFYRFVLFRREGDGSLEQTFRRADVVRLYLPLLEGEQTLTSGDIEIVSSREPELTLRGGVILTDGRTLELEPMVWRRGQLVALGGG